MQEFKDHNIKLESNCAVHSIANIKPRRRCQSDDFGRFFVLQSAGPHTGWPCLGRIFAVFSIMQQDFGRSGRYASDDAIASDPHQNPSCGAKCSECTPCQSGA
jgi:hypothetical protein